jgi:hypothetical protein
MKSKTLLVALATVGVAVVAYAKPPGATPADSGDADSFGRPVKFIGLITTGQQTFADDCTIDPSSPPGPDDHCLVVDPSVLTPYEFNDVGRAIIPANASNSLFCHWQTPSVVASFYNPTGSVMTNAIFRANTRYTLQNAVLNDPSLIDPATGLPFNGKLTVSIATSALTRTLEPGEFGNDREVSSRTCIGGLVSKRALIEGYGLSAVQAANFFKNDTAVTMDVTGSMRGVQFANVFVSTRIVGD